MTTPQQMAQCVEWFIETKSDTQVQRKFRTHYRATPPSRPTIRAWYRRFKETGSVLKRTSSGRPSTSDADVARVQQAFIRSPSKSIRCASRQLQLPTTTVHRVLHKRLKLHAYKVQLLHALQPDDRPKRKSFAVDILSRIDDDPDFLKKVMFTDEACFHVSGKVNRHNVRIWGSENPHFSMEMVRDSPKVNVWCGLLHDRVIGPFFFAEASITSAVYLDMLEQFAFPQIEDLQPDIVLQQDGAPPHWGLVVRAALDDKFPGRWVGRGGPIPWPPRSPDITPLDFFLWGFVKDVVYHTPVRDLRVRITAAIEQINADMLGRTWAELEYRLDILRATDGAHIELC